MVYRLIGIGCVAVVIVIVILLVSVPSNTQEIQYGTILSDEGKLEIVRQPIPTDFSDCLGFLSSLPRHDQGDHKGHDIDLRCRNVSNLALKDRLDDLLYTTFDDKTKWPKELPEGFDPEKIMEIGKNPGLGVRELHKRGITGKGVSIAIIDQPLLVDHVEYKDRLKLYEEIHWSRNARDASMHGPAVASIAVGKSVGVAPEANLYFIAEFHGNFSKGGEFEYDLAPLAKSIDRLVEINKMLNKEDRIRVVSISSGIEPKMNNYEMAKKSLDQAKEHGIFIVYVCGDNFFGRTTQPIDVSGLGRDLFKDPDDADSYCLDIFLHTMMPITFSQKKILVPMDSRCTASPTGENDYVFYRQGGPSWTIPYIAGLYALACQVKPEITPEEFWETLSKSSTKSNLNNQSNESKIINPPKFIEVISGKID